MDRLNTEFIFYSIIFLPLLTAGFTYLCSTKIHNFISIVGSFLTVCTIILMSIRYHELGFIKLLNFAIEPIGLILGIISSGLWFVTNLYSLSYLKTSPEINSYRFYIFIALAIFCTMLIALSSSLLILFISYEFLTIFTYPLVANVGTAHEKKAARFYLIFLLSNSLLLFLPAIIFIISNNVSEFVIGGFANHKFNFSTTLWLFILILYGVAKAAIVPVHLWLPRAMVAPIPVSAILHAVAVVKSGIIIILKFIVYGFGIDYLLDSVHNFYTNYNIITVITAISVIISSVLAVKQKTIKKLLAYSTINQLSLCVLIASMLTPEAINASLLQVVSHAFAKITLFFAAGYVYCNSKITEISDYKGLGKKMPVTMAIFTIAALSVIGVPIFAGFISKAFILKAALENNNFMVMTVLIFSLIASCYYFMRIISFIYFDKFKTSNRVVYEEKLSSSMLIALIVTIAFVIFMFVYTNYLNNLIDTINYDQTTLNK